MGGLKKYLSITNLTFLTGCIAIAGVPPFSGFFSKDEILSAALAKNPILYYIGVGGALLTAFYMFRLYAMTFMGKFRGTHEQEHHLHESPAAITFPLIVLAILSFVGGFINIPEVFVKDGNNLEKFLAPVFAQSTAIQNATPANSSNELLYMAISTILILITIFFAINQYKKYQNKNEEATGFAKVLENKWYVDELYDAIIVKPLEAFSIFLKNIVEKSGIDGIVNGVGRFVQYSSRQLRLLQSGQVGSYILFMVMSIVVLFLIFWNQEIIIQFFEKIF